MSFKNDVHKGLSNPVKQLSSKYFYNREGDEIFQRIMKMPEYYLTDSEFEIFNTSASEILKQIDPAQKGFDLIELGAGDGYKTKVLIRHFLKNKVDFRYIPIDISANVLEELQNDLQQEFPNLEVRPEAAEYFEGLSRIQHNSKKCKVILFLGSTIGNFSNENAREFLSKLSENLVQGDKILIGFDLKKNPKVILNAYNDKSGNTRDFNLNLLKRINSELGGNFELDKFDHYPIYDPVTGTARSFLVSVVDQQVSIRETGGMYSFTEGEVIHTEVSQKYSIEEIEKLAEVCGFKFHQHFMDKKRYYVDSLWIKE